MGCQVEFYVRVKSTDSPLSLFVIVKVLPVIENDIFAFPVENEDAAIFPLSDILDGSLLLDNVPKVILSASILVINDPTPTKLVLAVIIPDELICLTCFMSSRIYTFPLFIAVPPFVDV